MKYIVSKVKRNSVGQLGKRNSKTNLVSSKATSVSTQFNKFVPLFTAGVNRKTKLGKWEAKDLRKRLLVIKSYRMRVFLRSLLRTLELPINYRLMRINSLHKRTAEKAIINRCMISERSHGVEVRFALS